MKKLFIKGFVMLSIASITLFSCSSDDTQTINGTETVSKNVNSTSSRIIGEYYYEFTVLMVKLYGNQQTIGTKVIINQDGQEYLVSEVSMNNKLQGYFLEIPSTNEVFYLVENPSTGTLDQYSTKLGLITKKVYDLKNDPNYTTLGFSINTIAGKFFGGVYTYGSCGPDGEYGVYYSYYVFCIRVYGPKGVLDDDGHLVSIPCGTTYP